MSDPSWLKAAIDQRLALMNEALQIQQLQGYAIVMSPLTEPRGETQADLDRWEQSCDNCGKVPTEGIYTGHATKDVGLMQVIITFGVCAECKDLP